MENIEYTNVVSTVKRRRPRLSSTKTKQCDKVHKCQYCSYFASKPYLLIRHMRSHSEERPHKCTVCNQTFKTALTLNNHVNTHTGNKPYKCQFCDTTFATSGEVVRHVRYRHTHEKPYKCDKCEYSSVELSKLKRHYLRHTGVRPHQCPQCPYASTDIFKLKRHSRTHTGEKPYECDVCRIRFTQSNSLKSHKLSIHNISNERSYRCKICPSSFSRKIDLKKHIQNFHLSGADLKCKLCGNVSTDRIAYKIHCRTHEEKYFECDSCRYSTSSLQLLTKHMFVHGENRKSSQKSLSIRLCSSSECLASAPKDLKAYECALCSKSFLYKEIYLQHLNVHNPNATTTEGKKLALKLGRKQNFNKILENYDTKSVENTTISNVEEEIVDAYSTVYAKTEIEEASNNFDFNVDDAEVDLEEI